MSSVKKETIHYNAPDTFSHSANDAYEPIIATATSATTTTSHDCPICLDSLLSSSVMPVVRLKSCQHEFHLKCIQDCLNHHQCCPTCRKPVGEPQGTGPSGSMQITTINTICSGFSSSSTTTIQITYVIPSGTQKSYHCHPGIHYHGTSRTAYLPNNTEGQHLLSRLKYAFTHGLTFAIGTSLTSHQPNCVVWSSIHHKTSLSGGPHGFPDASYIDNTNESLDALNVPEATQLEPNKRQRSWHRQQRTTAPSSAAVVVPPPVVAAAAVVPAAPAAFVSQLPLPVASAAAAASASSTTGSSSIVPFVVVKEIIPYNPPPTTSLPPGYGTCPGGGTMSIEPIGSRFCPGFSSTTTIIQITYNIPNGIQQSYHDNPGLAFHGTSSRITYLPNNDEGRKLLKRMKYAWTRGWIFTIGTSMTTGKSNVVVWSSVIPHKTSINGGGPFGFPDVHYMTLCNQSLDALQVPPFHACP